MTDTTRRRSDVIMTARLVDSLIVIGQILASRDLDAPGLSEALAKLRDDQDMRVILVAAGIVPPRLPCSTAHVEPKPLKIKVLRSIYETESLAPEKRITEIFDFLDQRGRRKAHRMIRGLELSDARRLLDEAIMNEKL